MPRVLVDGIDARRVALSLGALLVPLAVTFGGGLPPQEGKRPCPPVLDDLHVSDPVFMATERFTHEQTDLSIEIPGGTLEFTRTYRSREYQPPNIGWTSPWHPLGPNWRHNFEADIKVRSHNDVTSVFVTDGSGRVDLYDRKLPFTGIPPTCPPSKREYYSSPGRDNVIELTYDRIDCTCVDPNRTGSVPVHADWQSIVEVIDPPPQPWPPETFGPCLGEVWSLSSIRIIRPDHSETRFELFVRSEYPFAGWRPVETTTADGTWLTYSYDACSRLALVSSGSGHWIRLHYAPDSPPPPNPPAVCADRLVAIEDNAGRWVHYDYWSANQTGGNNGDLKEAIEIGLPGDSPRRA